MRTGQKSNLPGQLWVEAHRNLSAAIFDVSLHSFSFPTPITFGPGARKKVGPYLGSKDVTRPLVVTDKGIAALPLMAEFARDLGEARLNAHVFGGVWGNPGASQVRAGVAAFRGHKADAVIGIGGGAALDVAKAVALMTAHDGDVLDY